MPFERADPLRASVSASILPPPLLVSMPFMRADSLRGGLPHEVHSLGIHYLFQCPLRGRTCCGFLVDNLAVKLEKNRFNAL